MLKIYRTCNPIVRFSKYEFNNKLLVGVTLLRVTPGVTLNNVILFNIFKLDVNFDKLIVELHYRYIFSMFAKFQGN